MRNRVTALAVAIFAGAVLLLSGGCASADLDALHRRAAFDLGCAQTQMRWFQIDERTWGVQGCGKRATYIESCDGPRDNWHTKCTWVMNNKTKR